jgi:hypothetical protein
MCFYMQIFYYSLVHNVCDYLLIQCREIFFSLGAEGTGGGMEGEAWASFTVYYSLVLGPMHVVSCVQGSALFPSL